MDRGIPRKGLAVAYTEKVGKRWRGIFRDAGDRKHSKMFDTQREAKKWALDRDAEVRGGTYADPRAGRLTLDAYVAGWLKTYRKSAGRVDQVQRTLRLHILPALGDIPLNELRPRVIQDWIWSMTDQGIAATSVRNYASTLAKLLHDAVEDERIPKSPYRRIELPSLGVDQRRFLDQAEADRLIAETPSRYRALVILALASGARWGELTGLKRHRFNPLRGTIDVAESLHELGGRFWLDVPKTPKSRRTIPLPRYAVAALNTNIAGYGVGRDDLIFTTPSGSPLGRANFRAKVFLPACTRAGIIGLRFHDLRHTSASWLLSDGIPITAVSQRLGHASVSMTLDCYSHVMPETGDVLLAVLDRRLGSAWAENGPGLSPVGTLGDRTGS
jgi:integrase